MKDDPRREVPAGGPELGDVLAAAADQTGPLAEALRELAEAILFAANEGQEP